MPPGRRRIFIDGKEYASIDEVPPHLRATVQSQAQGMEADAPDPIRRRMSLSAKGARGEGPSGTPLLVIAGVAFLLLVGLLWFLGR